MKYFLPCSCGQAVEIEVSQAGQTVTCECGEPLVVPAMRDIRKLQPVQEKQSAAPPRRPSWSLAQGLLFSIGLAIAAFGTMRVTIFEVNRERLDTKEVADWDKGLEMDVEALENMNLDQAWEAWLVVRERDIGPFQPPDFVKARIFSDFLKGASLIAAATAAFGVALMILAFLLPLFTGGQPKRVPQ